MPLPSPEEVDPSQLAIDQIFERNAPGYFLTTPPENLFHGKIADVTRPIRKLLFKYMPEFAEFDRSGKVISYDNEPFEQVTLHDLNMPFYLSAAGARTREMDQVGAVTIFGGSCLFSSDISVGNADGRIYQMTNTKLYQVTSPCNMLLESEPTPLAPESIARIGRVMLSAARYFRQRQANTAIRYAMHIPREEYIATAELAYHRGLITLQVLKDYWDIVLEKSAAMEAGFSEILGTLSDLEIDFMHPLKEPFSTVSPGELFNRTSEVELKKVNKVTTISKLADDSYIDAVRAVGTSPGVNLFVEDVGSKSYFAAARRDKNFKGIELFPLPLRFTTTLFPPLSRSSRMLLSERMRAVDPWYQDDFNAKENSTID